MSSTALPKQHRIAFCVCVLLAVFACCASEEMSHLEGAPGPSENLFPHIAAARLALQGKQAAFRAANFLKTDSTPRPRAEHVTAEILEWVETKHREAKRELNAAQEHLDSLVHLSKEELAINCKEYTGSKSKGWRKCEKQMPRGWVATKPDHQNANLPAGSNTGIDLREGEDSLEVTRSGTQQGNSEEVSLAYDASDLRRRYKGWQLTHWDAGSDDYTAAYPTATASTPACRARTHTYNLGCCDYQVSLNKERNCTKSDNFTFFNQFLQRDGCCNIRADFSCNLTKSTYCKWENEPDSDAAAFQVATNFRSTGAAPSMVCTRTSKAEVHISSISMLWATAAGGHKEGSPFASLEEIPTNASQAYQTNSYQGWMKDTCQRVLMNY